MDLIYMNANREDVGVIQNYDFDLAFGADENSFECSIDSHEYCCEKGCFLYMEGTEYGGLIDSIKVDSEADDVVYEGRTWHGILNSKVLEPNPGEDYLVLSGEANEVLATLLVRMGLESLFTASNDDSGINISNYKMNRYIEGYEGIRKMLKANGGKLKIDIVQGMVVLSAMPISDYTKDEEFDSDFVSLIVKKNYNPVNHLICLGRGELAEREVIHLYADASGFISNTQSLFGVDEVSAVFDYSSVESFEELEKEGIEKLTAYQNADESNIDFISNDESYDIGDIVGAVEHITGVSISAEITKKIITIKNGNTNITYKVGK